MCQDQRRESFLHRREHHRCLQQRADSIQGRRRQPRQQPTRLGQSSWSCSAHVLPRRGGPGSDQARSDGSGWMHRRRAGQRWVGGAHLPDLHDHGADLPGQLRQDQPRGLLRSLRQVRRGVERAHQHDQAAVPVWPQRDAGLLCGHRARPRRPGRVRGHQAGVRCADGTQLHRCR